MNDITFIAATRCVVSAILGVFFLWSFCLNWVHFYIIFAKRKTPNFSWIPIVGGLAGTLGMIVLPVEGAYRYAWVPLVADIGFMGGLFLLTKEMLKSLTNRA